jgi:hypothetical protein|tara:strand:- start:1522 stop:1695 length:174 start_codon:yes stop_codon:yes gene_type:complete
MTFGTSIGYQPRHIVDIEDLDEYAKFLQHREGMRRFFDENLFNKKRHKVVENKSKKK